MELDGDAPGLDAARILEDADEEMKAGEASLAAELEDTESIATGSKRAKKQGNKANLAQKSKKLAV